jgi:glycosyl hydrolase family 39 (putative alpha-L-iduronidase)
MKGDSPEPDVLRATVEIYTIQTSCGADGKIEKRIEGNYSAAIVLEWMELREGGSIRETRSWAKIWFGVLLSLVMVCFACGQEPDASKLTVNWEKTIRVSKTTATLQVVVNPPLRRGTAVHDNAFQALAELQADYVRYVPWLPYPRLGVAELEGPADGKTSWDFSIIDPLTIDFLEATKGHPAVLNFSTIPQWMYKTEMPVAYPADANKVVWNYEQGTELHDATAKEVGDYYARLLSWFTKGGFTDEFGKKHESGYHYSIPVWEVLNEVDFEHKMSAKNYTKIYDAVVTAMRGVEPNMKFVGMALALPSQNPSYFEYFLNHKNHKAGVPLDYISYHFYASPNPGETPEIQQYTFFAQADGFLNVVWYIEATRQRLSPETGTMINEIGVIAAEDGAQGEASYVFKPIPASYWHLAGALYAYIFSELTRLGIDVAGESQLVGYPTQFPSVSMVNWETGKPNARYWVLRLLKDNFGPGDKIVDSSLESGDVSELAVVTRGGKHRVLLVNKRAREAVVEMPSAEGGRIEYVDMTTDGRPSESAQLQSNNVKLGGFSVAVVTFP